MDDSNPEGRDPRAKPPLPAAVPMLPRDGGCGFAAEGPGFYVWDDLPGETRARAAALWAVARTRED